MDRKQVDRKQVGGPPPDQIFLDEIGLLSDGDAILIHTQVKVNEDGWEVERVVVEDVRDDQDDQPDYEALAYKIWRIDCPCGEVVDYDEDTIYPDNCEGCGAEVVASG